MPKLSVIVPIFNQIDYMQRCVDSLINQTEKDIEIILVDDGSNDGSAAVCDNYRLKNNNIQVIHKENGGLSSARNAGLRKATGDYIAFVDSDDWVELDTYEYCLGLISKYKADIAKIAYVYTYDNAENKTSIKEKIQVKENKEILQYYMLDTTKTGSYGVCWYVIHRDIINNIYFREGKINEDIDYMYKVLQRSKRIVISNIVKYYYYQKGTSLSTGGLKKKDFDLYEAADELWNLTKNENYGNIRSLAKVKRARTPLSLLCKIALYGVNDPQIPYKETVQKLQNELRKSLLLLLFSPIAMSRKALAVLFAINYPLTEKLVQMIIPR